MKNKIILAAVLALCAVSVFAQTPPGTYTYPQSNGGGVSSANSGIGGAGITGDSLTTVYDATAYGVVPNNGQACMDGNTTSGSATVTTLGSCTFHCPGSVYPCSTNAPSPTNDVGKQIFVTNMCSTTNCGPYFFDGSVNFLGATQTSLVTILSIQSATSLTASANAAATCSAKAGGANACTIVIAVDETAHINAMLTAGYLNSTPGCPRFQFPQGIIGFSAQLGTTQGSLSQCAINGGTRGHIQQLAEAGPAFVGVGQLATILVPLPNWNFAGWTTGTAIVSNSNGLAFIDIGISGFGQSFTAAGITTGGGNTLLATPYTSNFMFTGWANHVNSLVGVSLGGWGTISNSFIQAVGSTGGTVAVTSQNSTIINSSIAGFQALIVSGAPFTSNGNTYWGPQNTLPAIEIQNGGLMISAADTIQTLNPAPQAHTPVIQVDSGGTLYTTNFTNALGGSSFDGLKINAGGTAFVFGWRDTATPTNSLINAGTFTDEGANKFNGPVSGAGSFFGSYSITGTTITSAKLVLSAGWGASAAWTALSGQTQYIQGTITNTGAGQAANPTITYTFPTPFYSAPVCSAYQVGGTQAILAATEFLTPSAVTATGATFTYNGTPTVNLTEVIQILCQNP